ncbi:hypothetical protein N5D41_22915 [Pseudomonas toyotomiensis]|uniref:Lysozyme n=1 Tax=Ectopseudomonas toyotomiensis TaxID=554344 RepID=A0AA42IRG4_9GAMM|nr:hypothetical protein [Pseudomonas toyotomiensis]MDH0704332.1 hypothetical protein [Pseudomonas toyotomiensis]
MRGKLVPAALAAALASPLAYMTLERWEGNVLEVYADHLASGLPTYCAGRTDWNATVGTKLTSDQCVEINKGTLLEYGAAVLACTEWSNLTPKRLIGLTIFAINFGKSGACNSHAVKAINAGEISSGCNLIATKPNGQPNWSYSDGAYRQGLQNRRQAERTLCLAGQPL